VSRLAGGQIAAATLFTAVAWPCRHASPPLRSAEANPAGRLALIPSETPDIPHNMIEVRPATVFDDVRTMVGPRRADANVCWCLTYRIPSKENVSLRGPARGEKVAALMEQGPIGVLAYDGGEVVGWAAVARRADTAFARSRTIPHVDEDEDVWSIWCIRVRPGHRGKGISHPLLAGAVDLARSRGATAIEGYPVDNRGEKVDLTMAYVGTRALFEKAGFHKAADTSSVLSGFPRVLMRMKLR
jgi:GNAT superfamily N-acetyltransferase